MRRNLAHAFSDKALRGQEEFIQQYINLLVHRFSEQACENKPVDIMRCYNFTTFDVICDLTFGEPLYGLRDNKEHKRIRGSTRREPFDPQLHRPRDLCAGTLDGR
jgi:cytochrome P450